MKKRQTKTVVITGGTKGIGAGIAHAFYNEGYYVILGSRNDSGLSKKLGVRARFVSVDVRREDDHFKLVQIAQELTGQLNVYINCAGFSCWRGISGIDQEFLSKMIETNLYGTFWGCKAAAQYLTKEGCIINISSLAGKRGSANNSAYCMSKFGVIGLTQALAKELGPRGIRVNAICPVYVATAGLLEALAEKSSPEGGKNVRAYLKNFAQQQAALLRLPSAEEIASVCVFLASDSASAITGQSINVDCGVLPQ